jgi:dTDP-4-dehydrorhamnose 3,5-epimerase
MIFKETKLKGAFIIELEKHKDARGYFARAWCKKEFEAYGLNPNIVQTNVAFSLQKNTLRGMHFQIRPYQEAKLVRCIRGTVFDVIIDLRPNSITYCEWLGVELTSENHTMLYVPEGFAHGYLTLEYNAEVFYMVSQFYMPDLERGVRWDDPVFDVEWPETSDLVISEKDKNWPDYLV